MLGDCRCGLAPGLNHGRPLNAFRGRQLQLLSWSFFAVGAWVAIEALVKLVAFGRVDFCRSKEEGQYVLTACDSDALPTSRNKAVTASSVVTIKYDRLGSGWAVDNIVAGCRVPHHCTYLGRHSDLHVSDR